MTPAARISRIVDKASAKDLSTFEQLHLLPTLAREQSLTDGQEKVLADIERRIFGD